MIPERMKEGWVSFTRFYFKRGYIDRYVGDSYHNPNDEIQPRLCVNSSTEYYRLNGDIWKHKDDFMREFTFYLFDEEYRKVYTAQEIWTILKKISLED